MLSLEFFGGFRSWFLGQNVVVVKIMGGLGNQLFQLASGYALSKHLSVDLVLDLSWYEDYDSQRYGLDKFCVDFDVLDAAGVKKFLRTPRVFKAFRPTRYYEPEFAFNASLFLVSSPVLINGYWQSEMYFQAQEHAIRELLCIRPPLSSYSIALLEEIDSSLAVGLHVRRGDYVSDKDANAIHGVCSVEYYESAIRYMAAAVPGSKFFVFSDDIAWVRSNLSLPRGAVFVDGNGDGRNYEDLLLMSRCNHNIIANSSFSWWGAWLNLNPNKIVVAPKVWFKTDKLDAKDLVPGSWVRM